MEGVETSDCVRAIEKQRRKLLDTVEGQRKRAVRALGVDLACIAGFEFTRASELAGESR
jgi:hypothetical protein